MARDKVEKRVIKFEVNINDPVEAAIWEAWQELTRKGRASEAGRQALLKTLVYVNPHTQPQATPPRRKTKQTPPRPNPATPRRQHDPVPRTTRLQAKDPPRKQPDGRTLAEIEEEMHVPPYLRRGGKTA
jgi:hypothetical protein